MEVILLEKIENLGSVGEQVKVRPGYARNFLLPQGKAAMATKENVERVEAMRVELEKKVAAEMSTAEQRAGKIRELAAVTVSARAGAEGKLFGSIGTVDIAEACAAAGVEIARSEVRFPEGPLRVVGDHEVEIHLHTDLDVPLQVTVVAEE